MAFFQSATESYLMNDLYGLDPTAPSKVKDLKVLADLFGFAHGRFIASYPIDWANLLRRNLVDLSDTDKLKLTSVLKRLSDNTIPVADQYMVTKDWLTNATALQLKKNKFTKIVSKCDESNSGISLEKFLYEDDLPDARGCHIIADIKSYEATINPLFLVSTEIHIQDMYFYFWENNKKLFRQYEVLRMLISLASSTDRCERMVLHLNEEKFFTDSLESRLQEDLLQARRESGRSDLDITYTFEDRRCTHGRYIFSIKGGLQFDHGFDTDVRDSSNRNHVHWLSHSELKPLWDRYGI